MRMQAEVAAGTLHPMDMKKRLARTITAGFHGEDAAAHADENWARMFQQKAESEDLEEVHIAYADVAGPRGTTAHCRFGCRSCWCSWGWPQAALRPIARSARQAVKLDGEAADNAMVMLDTLPARIVVRLGKRAKVAVIGAVGEGA